MSTSKTLGKTAQFGSAAIFFATSIRTSHVVVMWRKRSGIPYVALEYIPE